MLESQGDPLHYVRPKRFPTRDMGNVRDEGYGGTFYQTRVNVHGFCARLKYWLSTATA